MIETVGVGQTELDIVRQADTTVVALVPESGDSIQAMKAGLMEVADIFVVNKADRDGAHALMAELRFTVHLHYASPRRRPRTWTGRCRCSPPRPRPTSGIPELLAEVRRHRALAGRERARSRSGGRRAGGQELRTRCWSRSSPPRSWRASDRTRRSRATLDAVTAGALDPYSAVTRILAATLRQP